MIKLIYVAGNYSKGDVAKNVKAALDAGDKLLEKGYIPFVPHLTHFWHIISPKPYETWLKIDNTILERSDAIYMLKEWESSNGAVKEYKLAKQLGLTIFEQGKNEPPDLNKVLA